VESASADSTLKLGSWRQHSFEGLASDEIHVQIRQAVRFAQVAHVDDVGMRQPAGCGRFA
jgi:hypothetical protein